MTKQEVREHYVDSCCMCTSTNCYDCEIPIVIECIEKQIPEKPKLGGKYRIYEWECPNCKSYFADETLGEQPRHCFECGQLIDWSDNE